MEFSDYTRASFKQDLLDHEGHRYRVEREEKESKKERGYFEGCLCALVAFYQEHLDHRNYEDVKIAREWLKIHLHGEYKVINGVAEKVGKSTKNQLHEVNDKVIEWLVENYATPEEAMNPKKYKLWKDTIFPYGGPDNYIDYMVDIGLLKSYNF
jgi:hypothetical protein